MAMTRRLLLWVAAALAMTAAHAAATAKAGIAWYGTWDAGLKEAKRLNRPILLISGAPQCNHVSGMW
jgi:hypothetical protein